MLRLADQKMNMFGHDDVANHHETIASAYLLEYFEEEIAARSCAEQRRR